MASKPPKIQSTRELKKEMVSVASGELKTPADAGLASFVSAAAHNQINSEKANQECEHDWQPDGQTMTAIRWFCPKCKKSKLTGMEI